MILILLTLKVTSTPYQIDYVAEGYATFSSDKSPVKITLKKGLALMMVNWPDAILKISIPGVLSSPIQLAAKNKYSLFTFADNATIDIVFKTQVSYFVIGCPQYNSMKGATQYISNYQNIKISEESASKDQYFSVFNKYKMEGSITLSTLGEATLYYSLNSSTKLSTKNLNPLNLPSIVFTSALIRSGFADKVSYKNLQISCGTTFSATVLTTVSLNWDSVKKDKNNFLANMAYGGSAFQDTLISSLIADLSKYTLVLQLETDLFANAKIEIDIGSGKSVVSKNQNYTKTSPFTAKLYVTYKECQSSQFAIKNVDEIGYTMAHYALADVQELCEKKEYEVSLQASFSSSVTFGYQKNNDHINTMSGGTGTLTISTKDYAPFKFSLYIKYNYCKDLKKVKEYSIEKPGVTNIKFSDDDIPSECKEPPKKYEVCANLQNLPKKYTIGYKRSFDKEDKMITAIYGLNREEYNEPFSITAYLISSPGCSDNVFLGKYDAKEHFICIQVTEDNIPSECKEPPKKYEVCADLQNLPTKYTIGYKRSFDKEDKMITAIYGLNREEYNEPFSITAYLISSPGCSDNILLGKYDAKEHFICIQVTEDNIPSECKEPSKKYEVCADLQNLPTKYTIGYKRSFDKEDKMITAIYGLNKEVHDEPFSITAYLISSPGCSDTILLGKYDASESFSCIQVTEDNIPSECKEPSKKYEVCADLQNLPTKYTIGYKRSFDKEDKMITAIYGLNKEVHDEPFSITAYLISSPGCSDNIFLEKYDASESFLCIQVTEDDIPIECTTNSDDSKTKNKNINLPLIAGISAGGIAIIVIGIVVGVVIMKKRKNKFDPNSQTLGSNLLNDNYQSNM